MQTFVVVDPVSSGMLFLERTLQMSTDVQVVLTMPIGDAFRHDVKRVRKLVSRDRVWLVDRDPSKWRGTTGKLFDVCARATVLCASEPGVAVADFLREAVKAVPRNVAGLEAERLDKYAAQERLRACGLTSIKSLAISSPCDVEVALATLTFPLVVKPANSAGSERVECLADRSELDTYVADVLGSRNALGEDIDTVVAQELIQGVEFVVDGAFFEGRPVVRSIGRYEKTWGRHGPIYRSLSWLNVGDVPMWSELEDYMRRCLEALGVGVGCFHFEAFHSDNSWVMVEVGLRPHGGGHPRYTEYLTGSSQVTLELGLEPEMLRRHGPPPLRHFGRVVFLGVDSECVVDRDPFAVLNRLDGVTDVHVGVGEGDCLRPAASLIETFSIGFVVVVADAPAMLDPLELEVRSLFASCLSSQ